MSQTIIPWGHPSAQKKWAAGLAVETTEQSYWTNRFIGKGMNNVIELKTDLEADASDRVSFDLSVQLRKAPTTGDQRVKGKGENLKFFSDEIIIDQARHEVSAGGKMTRKRTAHDLRKVAKDRLSEYWAAWKDELIFMYMSGARGINEDFIEDTDYAGHAGNPFREPDAAHIMYGGDATSKASIVAADKLTRNRIEALSTKVKMLRAKDPTVANMLPVNVGSEKHYVLLMSPYQEHDLRTEAGDQGWTALQKAAAAAEGRKNPIFRGGLGMLGEIVLHCHSSVIRFNDYGSGGDVEAARALLMGRQAGVMAYGVKNGTFSWHEEMEDRGNEPVTTAGTILGVSKARFNNKDFGVIALDTAAASPD